MRFFGTRKWPTRIALFNLEFCRAGIKIGVWLNSVDLNDLGRRSFELGSAHEKFGVYIRSKYTFFTWNVVYGVLAAEDEEL